MSEPTGSPPGGVPGAVPRGPAPDALRETEEAVSVDAAAHPSAGRTAALALGALGIVFGDIGTSPLYAIKECFAGHHAIVASRANVLGVSSLVFWSLAVVVGVKYLTYIMRADNRGEGGIFALLALLPRSRNEVRPQFRRTLITLALVGSALLYGDGVITPAISVLSAVEGLDVAMQAIDTWVVEVITVAILIGLFAVQYRGTGGIGWVFGPIMLFWFVTIGLAGTFQIAREPSVMLAVNPWYALRFFLDNGGHGFAVLGSVVLCITGGEALFADMGHFGRLPIRLAWYAIVAPALLLNYFGQGALLIDVPDSVALQNPFYALFPRGLLYPMTALSTIAAVVASQALISGVFSLTRSAVQLGFLPRVRILHTSGETEGQIYIPTVNWIMMLACIGIVLAFQRSTNLAAAYGIAVTAVMGITSFMWWVVADRTWGWSRRRSVPLLALFLLFDLGYFSANVAKIPQGGWFTIAVAVGLLAVMTTWKRGRSILQQRMTQGTLPVELFIEDAKAKNLTRVPGTAVFMSSAATGTPAALLHHVKHNKVLHEQVVFLSIQPADTPKVSREEELEVEELDAGFYRVTAHYGYLQTPFVPTLLRHAHRFGLRFDPMDTSFYLGRETLLPTGKSAFPGWRKHLFVFLARNAVSPVTYFGLPPDRVVELGMQIDL